MKFFSIALKVVFCKQLWRNNSWIGFAAVPEGEIYHIWQPTTVPVSTSDIDRVDLLLFMLFDRNSTRFCFYLGIRPIDFLGNFYMTNATEMIFGAIDSDKSVSVELKHDDKLPVESNTYLQVYY